MIVSSMEVMMTAPMERFVQDMATAQRASAGTMSDIEKSVDQLKASISSISSVEQSRAAIFARGFTDSKRLLGETKIAADSTAKSLEELKIDPEALKLPPAAFADLKTWQEQSAYAIGAGVGAGVVTAQAALEKFEEYVKAKAIITAAAIATGVAAAVFTGVYAAYKATDFAIGLLTGESYKSANIDALIELNKPLGALKKEFKLTTSEASALSVTLNSLGTSTDEYIGSFNTASLAVRNNSAQMDALGVAYKDAAGNALPMKDVLTNTSKVLDQYSSGWERNSVAVMLGFSSSAQVNTGLEVTAEKLAEVSARQAEYGLLIGQDQRDEISRYKTTMGEFNAELENTSQGLKVAIADNIMPILTDLADFFKEGWPKAVMAFRYSMATVTSLFYGLKTVFDIVVEAIVATLKAVHAVTNGIRDAFANLLMSDWSGAMNALVGGFSAAADRMSKIGENIVQYAKNNAKAMALAWGNGAVDAAKSLLGIEPAPVAPTSGKTASDAATVLASADAYKVFKQAIDEKIAAQKLEIQVGDKLTEGQRQALAFSMQLANGTLKISDAEKIARAEKLESLVALEKTNLKEQENRKKAEEAANKSAAASKKEVEAYASLMVSIGEKIAANKLEISGYDKLADSQKMSIKLDEEIKRSKNKLEPAHIKEARDLIAIVAAQEEVIKATKLASDAATARADLRRSEQSSIDSYFESQTAGYNAAVKGSRDALKSARDEYDQFGKTKSQIAEITLLTLRSAQAKLLDGSEGHIAAQHQIDDQVELIGILKKGEVREQYKEIFDSIDKTAHDTFVSMFDSGKSVFDRLRDTLKSGLLDLLYQMTIKKWILNIGAQVTGNASISNVAQGASGLSGLLGSANSASSLYSGVKTAAGWLGIGGATLGSGVALGAGALGTGAAAGAGALGSGVALGSGLLGSGAAATGALGSGVALGSGTLGAGAAAGTGLIGGASAALAAIPVWGWAALAAAAVVSFMDKGPEKNTRLNFTSNNAAGAISINERGNEGKNDAYIGDTGKSSFGTFGVSSTFWMEAAQPAVQSFIKTVSQTDDALAAFLTSTEKASVTSYLTGKTSIAHTGAEGTNPNEKGQLDDVFTDRINNILAGVEPGLESLVKDFDGTSQALATEAAALLQYRAALKDSGEALFGQVVTMHEIAALKAPTETSAEALKRVGDEFAATNQVATILGATSVEAFGSAGLASETARRQLVLFTGGADALASSTAAYSQNFMSDAERLAPVTKALGAAMDSLGLAGVTTKDQFRAAVQGLVNSGALATEEGAKQYAGLMAIQSTFTQVADAQAAQVAARRAIEIQIMEAQGNAIGATAARREDELTAMKKVSPELVDLQKNLYAVQDAATAAAEASTILGIQASMYEAMGDKAKAASVLELQHTAALVDMTPAVAAASIALWDAQKAEKARNTALANSNSILGFQAQYAATVKDKVGAAAVAQAQFNASLKDMPPEVARWATLAHNAKIAQDIANDAKTESNSILALEAQMYEANGDAVGAALTLQTQHNAALADLSPALAKATRAMWDAQAAAKALGFQKSMASSYQTDEQKVAGAHKDLDKGFADLHLTAPTTKPEWLAISEAADPTTKAGHDLLAALELLRPAFDIIQTDLEETAKAAAEAAKTAADALASTNKGYQDQIDTLRKVGMTAAQVRAMEIAGMAGSTVALYDRLHALQTEQSNRALEIENMKLAGNQAGALAAERNAELVGLNASTAALVRHRNALQDQAAALELSKSRQQVQAQIMDLQNNKAGALAIRRRQELDAMDAALRPMQVTLNLVKDLTDAYAIGRDIWSAYSAEGQKLATATDDLNGGFKRLNLSVPQTGEEFVNLALGIDVSTVAGRALLTSLNDLRPAFDTVQAHLKEVATARTAQELEMYNLTHTAAEQTAHARQLEIDAMDWSLRAYQLQLNAQKDLAAAAEERAGIELEIAQLLGNTTLAREREIAALDESNRALKRRAYALADADQLVTDTLAAVQRAVEAEKTSIQAAADVQVAAIQAGIDAGQTAVDGAQKSVDSLKGIFDDITSAVKTLRGNIDPQTSMAQAKSFIDMALSLAQAGAMPDAERLRDAIGVVTNDQRELYSSRADFAYAQLVQAGKLEALGKLTGEQKTVAEKQLDSLTTANTLAADQIKAIEKAAASQIKALDQQLTAAQDAVSVMRGVDLSVQSVATAVAGLQAAINALAAVRTATATATGITGTLPTTAPVIPTATTPDYSYAGGVPAAPISTPTQAPGDLSGLTRAQTMYAEYLGTRAGQGSASEILEYVSSLQDSQALASLEALLGTSKPMESSDDLLKRYASIPGFATGGDHLGGLRWVGENGPELESTGPSRIWNFDQTRRMMSGGGGEDLKEVITVLRTQNDRLEKQNERLEKRLEKIEENTRSTTRLIDSVTSGGNALRTDVVKSVPVAAVQA